MGYRRDIDGLRAVAALSVILFHAGLGPFSGGFVGVDVFFALSGYLITLGLAQELTEGRFSLERFYERRARRILPALILVALVALPFAWAWCSPEQLKDFAQALAATGLFASNLLFWREAGYFAPDSEANPLLHTWSLGVEEQFYLGFPLLLAALWRLGPRRALWSLGGLSLASLIFAELSVRQAPDFAFYLLPARAWELGAGALLALWTRERPAKPDSRLQGLGLALILGAAAFYDSTTPFPSLYALAPVGGTALVLRYGGGEGLAGRILESRLMVGLGLVSYSAYLWHQPVFAFARMRLDGAPSAPVMAGLCLLVLGLAVLSWRFVEQPFRRGPVLGLAGRRGILTTAAAASAGLIALGLTGHARAGFPERFPVEGLRLAYLESAQPSPTRASCHRYESHGPMPAESCRFGPGAARLAVFGDSHAVELAAALNARGRGLRQFTVSGCPPRRARAESPEDACALWTEAALAEIRADPQIREIVVSYRLPYYLSGDHAAVYPHQPELKSAEERARIFADLNSVLEELQGEGRRVIYVEPIPEAPVSLERLAYRPNGGAAALEGVPAAWWRTRVAAFREGFHPPEGVARVDPAEGFCGPSRCFAGKNGEAWYFDDDHPSLAGAARIAARLPLTP